MKTESRDTPRQDLTQTVLIDEPLGKNRSFLTPTKASSSSLSSSLVPSSSTLLSSVSSALKHDDARDEANVKEASEEREGPPKKPTPRKVSKASNNRRSVNTGTHGYDNPNMSGANGGYPPYPQGGHYPPPGSRAYGPPPPHYGYDPHYRPPHPHSYPPLMHHGQPPGGYPYGPPPHPAYHPYGGYPAPMPYPPPPHPMPSSYPPLSDNVSMASSKTKSSNKSKYSRKKRTIDQHQQQNLHYKNTNTNSDVHIDDPHHPPPIPGRRGHRRNYSSASTASTLSAGELSLSSSVQDKDKNDYPLTRASPKRRRGHDSIPIPVGTSFDEQSSSRMIRRTMSNASTADSAVRFQQLSVNDNSKRSREDQAKIFMTLSTSPIHSQDVDSTPISKNKKVHGRLLHHGLDDGEDIDRFMSRTKSMDSAVAIHDIIDRHGDTPTPPMNSSGTNVLTDQHLLNRHLRGQTFTPVPPGDRESPPKTGNSSFTAIQPQLSWSIAGDAPSLGDLAEWDEDRQKRPPSTTSHASTSSRAIALSPSSFTMWKELDPSNKHRTHSRDESLRLSMLSPHSDDGVDDEGRAGGATTPLPFFFGGGGQDGAEERENAIRRTYSNASDKSGDGKYGHLARNHHRVPENVGSIFVNRSGGASKHHRSASKSNSSTRFFPHASRSDSSGRGGMRMPPTSAYSEHEGGYGRSPPGRDGPPETSYYPQQQHYMGHPHHHSHMSDRVRNLRGRAPAHHAPMPLQVPPPVQSHHTLTSPMGVPSKMWGIPHPSPHHMSSHHSPHHHHHQQQQQPQQMVELMNPSKRKCVSLKPPIPSKFQGDIEKSKSAPVPEFTSLVNYPAHMSQKQSVNLPEGMRCCVMCGQACPCSNSTKNCGHGSSNNSHGSGSNSNSNKKHHTSGMQSNGKKDVSSMEKQGGFAIIPTQNKGLCTLCDVNVWVVCQSGLEIKWCKGCKNFRPWAAFGDKGLATKCLRCRERQREKYALQKEEKEKARVTTTSSKHM